MSDQSTGKKDRDEREPDSRGSYDDEHFGGSGGLDLTSPDLSGPLGPSPSGGMEARESGVGLPDVIPAVSDQELPGAKAADAVEEGPPPSAAGAAPGPDPDPPPPDAAPDSAGPAPESAGPDVAPVPASSPDPPAPDPAPAAPPNPGPPPAVPPPQAPPSQPGHPAPGYPPPQPAPPQQTGYPPPGYPAKPGYPQPGYPSPPAAYPPPQAAYAPPQPGYAQPGYPAPVPPPPDPHQFARAVAMLSHRSKRAGQTSWAVLATALDEGDVVEILVQGQVRGLPGFAALVGSRVVLVNAREWKPDVINLAIAEDLQVQVVQRGHLVALVITRGGTQEIVDQISDAQLAVALAEQVRVRSAAVGARSVSSGEQPVAGTAPVPPPPPPPPPAG